MCPGLPVPFPARAIISMKHQSFKPSKADRIRAAIRRNRNGQDSEWLKAHAGRVQFHNPAMRPVLERVLRVHNGYFMAEAVWRKIFNVWSCVKADPIIGWVVGMNRDDVQLRLLKLDARHEWCGPADGVRGGIHCPRSSGPGSDANDPAVRPVSGHSRSHTEVIYSGQSHSHHGTPLTHGVSTARPSVTAA